MNEALFTTIRDAFTGVTLGSGVGLHEGQGLDAGGDPAVCAEYRAKDEKNDWSRIPVKELNDCHSSLSFFDAEGMRFHIPAYLIAFLRGHDLCDSYFAVIYLDDYRRDQFRLLSPPQREAIRAFLLHLAQDEEYQVERPETLRALNEYWTSAS